MGVEQMAYGRWLAIALAIILGLVGVYDTLAIFSQGRLHTVSSHVQDWADRAPAIRFLAGLLMGHLFLN